MNLPEIECRFFYDVMATLTPELRPVFAERVSNILYAHVRDCEIAPGDCDRAIRQALIGLWIPPDTERVAPRWHRNNGARFEKVSMMAQPVEEKRPRQPVAGHGYVAA